MPTVRTKIQMNPREPLTKKAKAAIYTFVHLAGQQKGQYTFVLVEATLKAERMKREQLYQWLEERNYRWKNGTWKLGKTLKWQGDKSKSDKIRVITE